MTRKELNNSQRSRSIDPNIPKKPSGAADEATMAQNKLMSDPITERNIVIDEYVISSRAERRVTGTRHTNCGVGGEDRWRGVDEQTTPSEDPCWASRRAIRRSKHQRGVKVSPRPLACPIARTPPRLSPLPPPPPTGNR